jgi:histidine triad (HIT) family protein
MKMSEDCIFCKIVRGIIPSIKVYEDDKALAFMDIAPLNKGHLLVVPKDHVETILDINPQLYGHLASLICRLAKVVQAEVRPHGMNVMQLNGKAGNQVVPHVHMHLVPRWEGDELTICSWEPVMGNKDEISATADAIIKRL